MILSDAAIAILRGLEPEFARLVVLKWLKMGVGPKVSPDSFPRLATNMAGLSLPNPIGLAAGFDKDAEVPDQLLSVGFGFVECGTATPLPQPGNDKPRLFRLSEDQAVINRMGFNSIGLETFARRLCERRRAGIVGANIGANKNSSNPIDDYVMGLRRIWSCASYVAINVSSPNTPGLRALQSRDLLEELLGRTREARLEVTQAHGSKPLFLKVAPDLEDGAIARIVEAALAFDVDGLIVSNTTTDRPSSLRSPNREQSGGLSGKPLFEKSTAVLRDFGMASKGRLALVGVGGVDSAQTALAKIKAGASAVQLYTAWAYKGPDLPNRILTELDELLLAEGFTSVSQAVGVDLPTRALSRSTAA